MSQLQTLARYLLAAGFAALPDGQGSYLLYTNNGNLICKHWMGESFGKEELISTSVRPDSTAAILATPNDNLIISITSSSTLTAFQYDEDEEEWRQDRALSAYNVHAEGRLSACYTTKQRVCIVFQDDSGALVRIEEAGGDLDGELKPSSGAGAWTVTALKKASNPLPGTPISTILDENGFHVFYISAADQRIHHLCEDTAYQWADKEMSEHALGPLQGLFVSMDTEKGSTSIYALTTENAVLQIDDVGEKQELGKIGKGGELVPNTAAECSFFLYGFYAIGFYAYVPRRQVCCYW